MLKRHILKRTTKGSEGNIQHYAFRFLGKAWIVAVSDTKWHSGERFKRMPIWWSVIREGVPTLFIWNIAIGFDNRKKKEQQNLTP